MINYIHSNKIFLRIFGRWHMLVSKGSAGVTNASAKQKTKPHILVKECNGIPKLSIELLDLQFYKHGNTNDMMNSFNI